MTLLPVCLFVTIVFLPTARFARVARELSPPFVSLFMMFNSHSRPLFLLAAMALAGCTTFQSDPQTEAQTEPRPGQQSEADGHSPIPALGDDVMASRPSTAPVTAPATRDAQGRSISAHFAAPAGEGARVSQPDAAGTYRVLLDRLPKGGWRVQDFYEISGRPFSDPFVLLKQADLTRQPPQSVDGWLRQYHHGGGRMRVQLFRNGQAEGTGSTFYDGNKRKSVAIYRNGRPEGVGTFWHPNGKLALKVTYRNGKPAQFRGWNEEGEPLDELAAQAQFEHMRREQ